MVLRLAGILLFGVLGAASLYGSRAEACAEDSYQHIEGCGQSCVLTPCSASGVPGSTHAEECGSCSGGPHLAKFCCAGGCHCRGY
jgi:hypothetical protein